MIRNVCRSAVVVGLSVFVLAGCGGGGKARPPMGKVKGTVTYKSKPVSDASVTFIMDGAPRSASGKTDADGHFRLTTYDTNDGAFVGTHKVTVVKITSVGGSKPPEAMKPEDLAKMSMDGTLQKKLKVEGIPPKYADVKTTPLQFTIEAGENDKTLELED